MTTSPTDLITFNYANGNKFYLRGWAIGDPTPASDYGPFDLGPLSFPSFGWFQGASDWSAAPLIAKQSPSQIVANNRSFSYASIGVPIASIPQQHYAGPMDNAGIGKNMTIGGGGGDRCLVNDYSARSMRTSDPTAIASMFAQAMAADSVPIYYFDKNTQKLVNLLQYPLASTSVLVGQPSPYKPAWPRGLPLGDADGNYKFSAGWLPSTDHFPSMTYIAFQFSHDPHLVTNMQAAANFGPIDHISTTAHSGITPPVALIGAGQTRQFAWELRMLFEASSATQDAEALGILPAHCHPSSYWKTILANTLAYYKPQMADPTRQTFRLIGPDLGHIGQWQHDYVVSALAFGVLTGHTEFTQMYLWCLGQPIARTRGGPGDWPPAMCTAYKFSTVPGGADPNLPRFTYKQAFDNLFNNSAEAEILLTTADHDEIMANPLKYWHGQDDTSAMGCYAVLAQADQLDAKGLAGVRVMYPEFDKCLINATNLMKDLGHMYERYCIPLSGTVITPPNPIPDPGPVTPPPSTPPATGGTMTTIIQGSSYLLSPKITVPQGAVHYGVKKGSWTIDKPDQADLVPQGDAQATAKVTAKIDTTAEDVVVGCDVFTDAAKTKTIHLSITLSDVLVEATAGTMDVTPIVS